MTNRSREPGNPESEPIESRRTPAAAPVGAVTPDRIPADDDGPGSVLDLPDLGEFSAEAARPTPLDAIAEAERKKAPKD